MGQEKHSKIDSGKSAAILFWKIDKTKRELWRDMNQKIALQTFTAQCDLLVWDLTLSIITLMKIDSMCCSDWWSPISQDGILYIYRPIHRKDRKKLSRDINKNNCLRQFIFWQNVEGLSGVINVINFSAIDGTWRAECTFLKTLHCENPNS